MNIALFNTIVASYIFSIDAGGVTSTRTIVEDETSDYTAQTQIGNNKSQNIDEDLRDVGYYLRSHKFNEYDRRYYHNSSRAPKEYYGYFPKPSLRSLHWEVKKYCESGFSSCFQYLVRQIRNVGLKREDDTTFVMQEQNWVKPNNSEQIETVDEECRKLREIDDKLANSFQGPIERFQWRTTASYYMCWYTMKEETILKHFGESCDNFAYCLDSKFGIHNEDPRANDDEPFSCSLYSFCPDPCCPIKHFQDYEDCWQNRYNPCLEFSPAQETNCFRNRSENDFFVDIILNRWNVSCKCPNPGFVWDSQYSLCVDIDECVALEKPCNFSTESCLNLPGSYLCICTWGYTRNPSTKQCESSPALKIIKAHNKKETETVMEHKAQSLVKRLPDLLFKHNSGNKKSASVFCALFFHHIMLQPLGKKLIWN